MGGLVVVTADDRPDLWVQAEVAFLDAWPEYNLHGDVSGQYFAALVPCHAHLQFLIWDAEAEQIVARGRTIPFRWDGTLEDLPAGIDAMGLRAVSDPAPPTVLSALAAEVVPDRQGRGVSKLVIEAMAHLAGKAGLDALVAPVRPSWKDRYPLIPIEQYATWSRADGLPFDPWLRVHVRLGATILRPEPHSMRITGSVAEWASWTGIEFPTDGQYVFPGGLAPKCATVPAATGSPTSGCSTACPPRSWLPHAEVSGARSPRWGQGNSRWDSDAHCRTFVGKPRQRVRHRFGSPSARLARRCEQPVLTVP